MSDLLNRYFERELALVRRAGDKFKASNPDAANAMHLNEKRYEDPNITRLLESMALLSAKNEMKLDQQLPHISGALSSILYPAFNQLLPSLMSVSFAGDPEAFVEPVTVEKAELVSVENSKQQLCQFQFCNDVTFSPLALENVSARFAPFPFDVKTQHNANAVIQLQLTANDPEAVLSEIVPDNLDLYLHGFGQGAAGLIELMLSQLDFILVSDPQHQQQVYLERENFSPRCIEQDFRVLEKQGNEFAAYQMMLEYFNYSEKRKYFHIKQFAKACKQIQGNQLVISFFVKDMPSEYIGLFDTSVFQLNTALVINQFHNRAEPVHYDHRQLSVPLVADAVNQNSEIEIIAIDNVQEIHPEGETLLQPLFAKRYFDQQTDIKWFAESHINHNKQRQQHIALSFNQKTINYNNEHLLAVRLNCCNGRAPCSIDAGQGLKTSGAIELPGELLSHNIPSVPYYPNEDQDLHWRLVELLSTNFSSLMNTQDPTEKLKNLLSVFSRSSQQQVLTNAIQKVSYKQKVARIYVDGINIFASGTLIHIDISAFDKKNAMNIWLFAHLLNQFFAAFCSFDRFIELHVDILTASGKHEIKFDKHHGSQQCL